MASRTSSHPKKSNPERFAPQVYPFTAIVGQEEMKLALLLNVIDPLIGGVLIMGHRGTGKSTAVRALADLLPPIWKVTNCQYGCNPSDEENLCGECYQELAAKSKLQRNRSNVPVVNLPLGATEDRVCGTIDIERALKEGVKSFEPGLLARANRGFLYIDEVNLLDDHLVDLLLDVAMTGRNTVEREGISLDHPARFVLVGSGNPEEGELRPQLVDRFGLCAEVETLEDLDQRVQIVERREAFERDPYKFRLNAEAAQTSLERKLTRARKKLSLVKISPKLMREVAGLCLQLRVDGHRGELTIVRAARAMVALEGRREVTGEDIRRITPLALRHRLRRDPLEPTGGGGSRIEQALDNLFPDDDSNTNGDQPRPQRVDDVGSERFISKTQSGETSTGQSGREVSPERPAPEAQAARLPDVELHNDSQILRNRQANELTIRTRQGRRDSSYNARRGRYSRAVTLRSKDSKVAIDATVRASAMSASRRQSNGNAKLDQKTKPMTRGASTSVADLRFKTFKRKKGTLFIMAIDTSGSMAMNRIERAKGALSWLLGKSYISRDQAALISFRGNKADELLQPSQSMSRARRLLDELLMGGPTPLASALLCAWKIACRARRKGTERIVLLILTDGRANVPLRNVERTKPRMKKDFISDELEQLSVALTRASVSTIIVDTQSRYTSGGEARNLANRLGARYVYLSSSADSIEKFANGLIQTSD
jgi:magnesium chelatase subunit D